MTAPIEIDPPRNCVTRPCCARPLHCEVARPYACEQCGAMAVYRIDWQWMCVGCSNAVLAQLAERRLCNSDVRGSIPRHGTITKNKPAHDRVGIGASGRRCAVALRRREETEGSYHNTGDIL